MIEFATQKAQGVSELTSPVWPLAGRLTRAGTIALPTMTRFLPYDEPFVPCFIRPCPITPRHGFVESQWVTSWRQLIAVVAEGIRQDPEAEFIIMPQKYNGSYSAILSDYAIHFGHGHDGVTGGKEAKALRFSGRSLQAFLNAGTGVSPTLTQILMRDEGIFVELVEKKDFQKFVAVQARSGPKVEASAKHFIPKEVKVTKILSPDLLDQKNLLRWEVKVRKARRTKGTVIHLPNAALTSHYAIHGIINNVPVWTGSDLDKGHILKPVERNAKLAPMNKAQLKQVAASLAFWLSTPEFSPKSNVMIGAYASAHAMLAWGNEWHENHMRGFSVAALCRASIASCLAEARHYTKAGPLALPQENVALIEGFLALSDEERIKMAWEMQQTWEAGQNKQNTGGTEEYNAWVASEKRPWAVPWDTLLREAGDQHHDARLMALGDDSIERESAAGLALKMDPIKLLRLGELVALDHRAEWQGHNFGGKRWYRSTVASCMLLRSALEFIKNPSQRRWLKVQKALNLTANAVHNGGRVLSKWIATLYLDTSMRAPTLGLASPFVADLVLGEAKWRKRFRKYPASALAKQPIPRIQPWMKGQNNEF